MKSNASVAFILNLLVCICEGIGLFFCLNFGLGMLQYFTILTGIMAFFVSLIYVIAMLQKKDEKALPYGILMARYVSAASLAMVFLVVIALCIADKSLAMFYEGFFLYMHLLAPIFSVISFIIFEGDRRYNRKKNIGLALLPVTIYGVVIYILNFARIVDGPYPFLHIYSQPWYMSVLYGVSIGVACFLISKYILYFNQKYSRK